MTIIKVVTRNILFCLFNKFEEMNKLSIVKYFNGKELEIIKTLIYYFRDINIRFEIKTRFSNSSYQ